MVAMYHPETMYEMAKLKMAEDLRTPSVSGWFGWPDRRDRPARSTRSGSASVSPGLLGAIWPSTPDGATRSAA